MLEKLSKNLGIDQAINSVVEKITGWVEGFIVMLPNLVVAIVVVVLFWFISILVVKVVRKVLGRVLHNVAVTNLLTTLVKLILICVGLFVALGILKLDKTVTSLLAGVGVVGLALGFAFQELAASLMSGILISIRKPFKIGDIIKSGDTVGVVKNINLRATIIKTFQGQTIHIPNQTVFGNPMVNYSDSGGRRIDLPVGVSYDADLQSAAQIATDAVSALEVVDSQKPVELFYTEFGGSSINFTLRFWIKFENKQADYLTAKSQAIIAIKKAFDANDINIPFPIRTLDINPQTADMLAKRLK